MKHCMHILPVFVEDEKVGDLGPVLDGLVGFEELLNEASVLLDISVP